MVCICNLEEMCLSYKLIEKWVDHEERLAPLLHLCRGDNCTLLQLLPGFLYCSWLACLVKMTWKLARKNNNKRTMFVTVRSVIALWDAGLRQSHRIHQTSSHAICSGDTASHSHKRPCVAIIVMHLSF